MPSDNLLESMFEDSGDNLLDDMFEDSSDDLLGDMFPAKVESTSAPTAKLTPVTETPPTATDLFGITHTLAPETGEVSPFAVGKEADQMDPSDVKDFFGTPYSLTPSIEEVSHLETDPFFRMEMVDSFMETMDGLESLRQQPKQAVKGAAEFFLSIPGFLTGVGVAAQRGSKNLLDQITTLKPDITGIFDPGIGRFDLEEFYDVLAESMADSMEFFEPAKQMLLGKPTPESQLVGGIAMAPVMALSRAGQEVAEWPRFEDSPNIRGIAKLTGDVTGFIALGAVLHKGIRTDVAKRSEAIVAKAQDIKVRTEMVEKVDNEALQRAQIKILEIQKAQLELEAAELKKTIEKGVDLDPPLKKDLKAKGKKVKDAKAEVTKPVMSELKVEFKKATKQVKEAKDKAKKAKGPIIELKDKKASVEATKAKNKKIKELETRADEIISDVFTPKENIELRGIIDELENLGIRYSAEGKPRKFYVDDNIKSGLDVIEGGKPKKGPILTKEETDALIEPVEPEIATGVQSPFDPDITYTTVRQRKYDPEIDTNIDVIPVDVFPIEGGEGIRRHEAVTDYGPIGTREPLYVKEGLNPETGKWETYSYLDPRDIKVTELDRQTGVETTDPVSGEQSPFYQSPEESQAFKGVFEGRKSVNEDVEIFTQKLGNDVNLAYHGDESIPIEKVRDTLRRLAAEADDFRMDFLTGVDHLEWKETVSNMSEWASGLRLPIEQRGTKLFSGVPVEEVYNLGKKAVDRLRTISMAHPMKRVRAWAVQKLSTIEGSLGVLDSVKGKGWKALEEAESKGIKESIWKANFGIKQIEKNPNVSLNELLPKIKYGEKVVKLYSGIPIDRVGKALIDIKARLLEPAGEGFLTKTELEKKHPKSGLSSIDRMATRLGKKFGVKFIGRTTVGATEISNLPAELAGKELQLRPDRPIYIWSKKDPNGIERIFRTSGTSKNSVSISAVREKSEFIDNMKGQGIDTNILYSGIPLDEAVKLIGNVKKVLDRTTLETLRKSGWKWRPATLEQAPGLGNRPNKMWRMIEPTSGIKRPVILEPPKKGFTLRTGPPLDEAGKAIIAGAKKFKGYVEKATGLKKFRPGDAARMLSEEFKRSFVDRSGNIRLELLDKLGDEGYKVVQKMYLTKGANSLSANMLNQMRKEVYQGMSKHEKGVLDKVILAGRMVAIGKTESGLKFNYPEGLTPAESAAYSELFPQLENIPPERAQLINDRAEAYYEWMKMPLKDMRESGLISAKEEIDLAAQNYRKLKLVDIYDKKYTSKIGKKKITIYDSGVEALAKGRTTDVFEPSSEIMALEVFNRTYGRVLNNEAYKALASVAKNDSKNPFARVRKKGEHIPAGWQRIFGFEEGERKSLYISPEMSKEWITNNSEISYRTGQYLRWASGSPMLRTFATGINWGFAVANLPRDVMHTWFAARMFSDGKWSGVYSNNLPIFLPQIGADLARTFTDAVTKGPRYQEYIKEGGGMEFLVHQGRLFQRGRRLEGPADKIMDFLGYFGETSEIMTRLAIRDRVIRKRGKEQGLTMEEARKNKDITQEATFAARDYMDFGQGGGITKAADNAIPYLNAGVQGTRGLWRTAVENKRTFAYKIAQLGAVTTLTYAAAKELSPNTMANLEGSEVLENNLVLPLGDSFSFEDERGQTRYMYFKMPLDPGQKFFNTFFQASYDKYKGNEVDVDRVVESLKNTSPVGISNLPPTASAFVGYVVNKDFWRNEDIWKKTEPFTFPKSKEEFIPGRTSQVFMDIGKATGFSPERLQFATEELTTSGTMWSYLAGKGYEKLFADVPQEKKEQHVAMTLKEVFLSKAEGLSKTPIIKRFFGVTNPYSKYAGKIEEAQEADTIQRFVQNRELDRLTEGHLFEDSVTRKEVFKYVNSFKEKDIRDRLTERFDYQQAIKDLPERSFWLRLKGLNVEPRAQVYYDRWKKADEAERKQLAKEVSKIGAAGKVITDGFWNEFSRLRLSEED